MSKIGWDGGGTRAPLGERRGEEEGVCVWGVVGGCHLFIAEKLFCGACTTMRHRNTSPNH